MLAPISDRSAARFNRIMGSISKGPVSERFRSRSRRSRLPMDQQAEVCCHEESLVRQALDAVS